jgi:hypothetical protein
VGPVLAAAVQITITPPNGHVPYCATVHGTATMPNGEPVPKHLTVWAAQHVSGESEYFDLTKVTQDADHPERWHVQFTLGDPDQIKKEFVVYAFALGAEATELLERIETAADPEDAYSYFFLKGSLPVQDGVKGERFQRIDHDTKPCQ